VSVRLTLLLAALVSLSGAAALGHELLWIRALALHFGNTTHAITAVVATFMAGLACGNAWVGRLADRVRSPLRLYLLLELVAAVSGCVVSLFLLLGGAQLDALARWCAAAGDWSTPASVAVFAALMLLPTTVMGGTLPVLSRTLSRQAEPGRALALLYACNTLGAVLGALAPDSVLIPRCGMLWTALAVAGCNLVVALLVWPLARAERCVVEPAAESGSSQQHARDRSEWLALWLSGATGFCALGLEVLWSRTLQAWAAAFVTSFAVLLALYLCALALGTWLARRFTRGRSPLTAACLLCLGAGCVVLLCVYTAPAWRALALRIWPSPPGVRRAGLWHEAVATALHASYLEGAVCLLLGAAFPCVAAAWLRRGQPGRRTGQLFAINTLAGVLGSLVTGFWWLPHWGEQTSYVAHALVLAGTALLCAWLYARGQSAQLLRLSHGRAAPDDATELLTLSEQVRGARAGAWACSLLAAALAAGVFALPARQLSAAHFQGAGEVLALREGTTTSAAAVAHYVYGELHYLELQTPGVSMSNTRLGARRYMASLAHAGMLFGEHARKRALLICYGVGNTAQALLAHRSLQQLDVVDISPEVLSLAPYFAAHSGHAPLLDPRTHVFIDDGRHHLITHDEVYDVITAEPPPPNHVGVVNLYTREFYRLAKHRLSEAGVITQWLPVFQLSEGDVRSMIAAFTAELPHTLLLYGYQQQLILVGSRRPLRLADAQPDSALLQSLQNSGLVGVEDLLAGVLLADAALRRATQNAAALDDLHPSIAYPFEPVSEAQLNVYRYTPGVHPARLGEPEPRPASPRGATPLSDPQLPRLAAAQDALPRALTALELVDMPRSEARELALGRLLQPALDARPDDEHIWALLAADRDRVRVAEAALARPGAPSVAAGARYAVLQDARWLLARRAFYARDYARALSQLDALTPEPGQQALHALLRAGTLRALGGTAESAQAFRAAASGSHDRAFQAACQTLAEHAADPIDPAGPWSMRPRE
jgi:spermidine synthase